MAKKPAKKRKAPVPPDTQPASEPTVPPELTAKVQSIKAITSCHTLLQRGHFPYHLTQPLGQALAFLSALHTEALADAEKHPDAHLVPELATAKAKKEAQSGQAQSL